MSQMSEPFAPGPRPAPLPQRKETVGPAELKDVRQHRRFASLRAISALILRGTDLTRLMVTLGVASVLYELA